MADNFLAEYDVTYGDMDAVKAAVNENTAGILIEPIQGEGGVVMPPADYLQRINRLCRDNDILYVSDEVVTAFGRCGEWFVSESMFGPKLKRTWWRKREWCVRRWPGLTSKNCPGTQMIWCSRPFLKKSMPVASGSGRSRTLPQT